MRVIVCGSRHGIPNGRWLGAHLSEELFVRRELRPEDLTLVHGAARGVDSIAAGWAAYHGVTAESHPAKWNEHGRAAGPIRNRLMLSAGVDLVIAFPGGRGTADMVRAAKAAGVEVIEVDL